MEDLQKDISREITQPVDTEGIANGPILILLVVLLLAILGGMYRWFVILNNDVPIISAGLRPSAEENNEPESTTAEARVEAMGVVSSSDEIPAIEADIESTDLDSMESELDAIEAELDAALEEGSEPVAGPPATEVVPAQ
jgi:hypothetical protein